MFSSGIRDLVRDQWIIIIEQLKLKGEMSITDLASFMGMSYMGVKQHCEALHKLGYLDRLRTPRKEVGRPEITYHLSRKVDAIFPDAGISLTLSILKNMKNLFGSTAPEKLLFQYFVDLQEQWKSRLSRAKSLVEKATILSDLRQKEGCFSRCFYDVQKGFRIKEFHHPLWEIFIYYPSAVMMELRMMEQLLGTKIERIEILIGKDKLVRVDYVIITI
jgi:predicted ArsR family transcriptional regulator